MGSDPEKPLDPKRRIARASQKEVKDAKPVEAPQPPSPIDEAQSLDLARLGAEIQGLRDEQERLKDIHWARLVGLLALFLLVVGWLISILRFVYWSGTDDGHGKMILKLEQPVVLALIGSTTLNVLGLFLVAAKWLYPSTLGKK